MENLFKKIKRLFIWDVKKTGKFCEKHGSEILQKHRTRFNPDTGLPFQEKYEEPYCNKCLFEFDHGTMDGCAF